MTRIAIIVGSLLFVGVIVFAIFFIRRRRQGGNAGSAMSFFGRRRYRPLQGTQGDDGFRPTYVGANSNYGAGGMGYTGPNYTYGG